jgi:phosphotransferase system enzyme I (PtsI)
MLQGVPVSPGIGIGKAVLCPENPHDYSKAVFAGADVEKKRLAMAKALFLSESAKMEEELRNGLGTKEAEIMRGHITIIEDPFMISQMENRIEQGCLAEAALDEVCGMYASMFAEMDDELMRARSGDFREIRERMLDLLTGAKSGFGHLAPGSVLCVRELAPFTAAAIDRDKIAAILTEIGGTASHGAILARAKGIPTVMGISGLLSIVKDGEELIADGKNGTVWRNPDERTLSQYIQKQDLWISQTARLLLYKDKPTLDADGNNYGLLANIGGLDEAKAAMEAGAEGAGLFRTEFLFMNRKSIPGEDEQYEAYAGVARLMKNRPVIIRTLDIGGDKDVPYLMLPKEDNPFLGHRAIRYCLESHEVFSIQLRAILRASAIAKNIKIMLPLVTDPCEVREAKSILERAKLDLASKNIPFYKNIQLGIMIETPASVLISAFLANEADFFSIGTNDLTQYTLAVDRGNPKVEKLYSSFHPAVLRSVRMVIQAAKYAGIPVGMCGEAASDPLLIPLFLAFGLQEFSVNPSSVLAVRKEIASWSMAEAKSLALDAMNLATRDSVHIYLRGVLEKRENLLVSG